MNLIFYTSEDSLKTSFTKYYLEQIAKHFSSVIVVSVISVSPASKKKKITDTIKLFQRKKKMWSWVYLFEFFLSYPIKKILSSRDQDEIESFFKRRISGEWQQLISARVLVNSVNGVTATATLKKYHPDIILQAGAGLLKSSVIGIPTISVINIHHGIAPLLRGMDSIYWAKWKRKKAWLGATIHFIDEGIDTGRPLKYVYPQQTSIRHSYSSIFCELSVNSIIELIKILKAFSNPQEMNCEFEILTTGESTYKSSFSGFKMLMLRFFY